MNTPDTTLVRAKELKLALNDFILDAEDELATALETFSAEQLARQQTDMHRREFIVDRFAVEGHVGEQTTIDLFIANSELDKFEQEILRSWRRSFMGLFAVVEVLADGFKLMNWTTAKYYRVKLTEAELKAVAKLKEGDILLTQIAPVNDGDWMFFSKWISLGRLGKPKLAVAIGNFKQNYRPHLYSDAPELLAEAWKSVEQHHQNFIDFFGGDEITMPGYQFGKKLAEFQETMTQKQLKEAGIDESKSLQEIAEEAGVSQEEIEEAATEMGADVKLIDQALNATNQVKMMSPNIELPAHLKKAEQLTILTHPRCGQTFLTNYVQFKSILETGNWSDSQSKAMVQKYLTDPEIPAFVWHRLAQQYPQQLEAALAEILERPFKLADDLDSLLQESGKNLKTELPEIASVPLHLHNLFQDAVLEVSKDKSKKKTKTKTAVGFKR